MRACLYTRISTGEQSKFSLDGQKKELLKYCEEKGHQVMKDYSDTLSGLLFEEREGLQKLLDDSEKGVFELILVTETDRLARDTEVLGFIKLSLQMKGVQIVAINEPEVKSEYDELIRGVIALFGSFEAKRRKRRCLRGISEAKKQGKVLNRIPLGYKLVNAKTKERAVLIDSDKAEMVKKMYQLKKDGLTVYAIARSFGMNKASVSYILRNPFYTDGSYLCQHEPLITNQKDL